MSVELFTDTVLRKLRADSDLDAALEEVNICVLVSPQDLERLHEASRTPAAKKVNRFHKQRNEITAILCYLCFWYVMVTRDRTCCVQPCMGD